VTVRFSICNEMFEGWEFDRVCAAAAEAGYGGIEVAPFTLAAFANEVTSEQRRRMRESASAAGVEIVGLHWLLAKTIGFHINHPDKAVRDRTVDYMVDLTNLCADLGGEIMVFGSPKQRNVCEGLSYRQAWDHAVETFGRVVPLLEKRNVTLCLEPLSPAETDFLNTANEAAGMVRRIGSHNVRLLLDVKAMSSESKPISDIIRAHGGILRHFHANDANMRGPGFGDTDFGPIASALKDIDYAGWVSVEVFDFKPDPVTIARKSIDYMKRVF
jgi:sugar phosphate isomerase/epimerase